MSDNQAYPADPVQARRLAEIMPEVQSTLSKKRAIIERWLREDSSGVFSEVERGDEFVVGALIQQNHRNWRAELENVGMALQRIEDGKYGICISCGAQIPLDRLLSLCWAVRCVECQANHDRRRRR